MTLLKTGKTTIFAESVWLKSRQKLISVLDHEFSQKSKNFYKIFQKCLSDEIIPFLTSCVTRTLSEVSEATTELLVAAVNSVSWPTEFESVSFFVQQITGANSSQG